MPRVPRPQYEGAIYHVYQRGNNKDYIFNDQLTCISKSQVPMEDLLKQTGISESINPLIIEVSQNPSIKQYKYIFITLALKEKYTLKQIGGFLNISESAVSKFLLGYNQKNG